VRKYLPSRDSLVWTVLFLSGLLIFLASETTTLVPGHVKQQVLEAGAVLAFIGAKLGNSPLPGRPRDPE
jgi:hypothetical protein